MYIIKRNGETLHSSAGGKQTKNKTRAKSEIVRSFVSLCAGFSGFLALLSALRGKLGFPTSPSRLRKNMLAFAKVK